MASIWTLISLLIQLGPQFATVWKLILDFIQAHQSMELPPGTVVLEDAGGRVLRVMAPMAGTEQHTQLASLATLSVMHGTSDTPAFNWQILLQIWMYLQQHPELIAVIKSIIDAFLHAKPAPVPAPIPNPLPIPVPFPPVPAVA